MSSLFWRILIAVVAAVAILALLDPVSQLLGFPLGGPLLRVFQICIAAIAFFYVVAGKPA